MFAKKTESITIECITQNVLQHKNIGYLAPFQRDNLVYYYFKMRDANLELRPEGHMIHIKDLDTSENDTTTLALFERCMLEPLECLIVLPSRQDYEKSVQSLEQDLCVIGRKEQKPTCRDESVNQDSTDEDIFLNLQKNVLQLNCLAIRQSARYYFVSNYMKYAVFYPINDVDWNDFAICPSKFMSGHCLNGILSCENHRTSSEERQPLRGAGGYENIDKSKARCGDNTAHRPQNPQFEHEHVRGRHGMRNNINPHFHPMPCEATYHSHYNARHVPRGTGNYGPYPPQAPCDNSQPIQDNRQMYYPAAEEHDMYYEEDNPEDNKRNFIDIVFGGVVLGFVAASLAVIFYWYRNVNAHQCHVEGDAEVQQEKKKKS